VQTKHHFNFLKRAWPTMLLSAAADILLIRHAPTLAAGQLAGRLDVQTKQPAGETLALARRRLAELAGGPSRVVCSPARRCLETAAALCPGMAVIQDTRLWEQDFGAWEGRDSATLPDLGPLNREQTAAFRPPGGESFLELATRAAAALTEFAASGPAIIFAHAGTVRVGLGLALGRASLGLIFEVTPLSATLLRALPGGEWSIGFVNLSLTGGAP